MALMTQAVYQKLVRDIDVIYEDARKALVHWDLYILNDGTFFSPSPQGGMTAKQSSQTALRVRLLRHGQEFCLAMTVVVTLR